MGPEQITSARNTSKLKNLQRRTRRRTPGRHRRWPQYWTERRRGAGRGVRRCHGRHRRREHHSNVRHRRSPRAWRVEARAPPRRGVQGVVHPRRRPGPDGAERQVARGIRDGNVVPPRGAARPGRREALEGVRALRVRAGDPHEAVAGAVVQLHAEIVDGVVGAAAAAVAVEVVKSVAGDAHQRQRQHRRPDAGHSAKRAAGRLAWGPSARPARLSTGFRAGRLGSAWRVRRQLAGMRHARRPGAREP